MANRARSACIQCSYCTQLCPRYLLGHPIEPHKVMRKMASGMPLEEMLEDKDLQGAALCCQCGIWELYACPMALQPRRVNALVKELLAKSGWRYTKPQQPCQAREERALRLAPTKRVSARTGVLAYNTDIDRLEIATPTRVVLPLQQHIGAPAVPVMQQGAVVQAGELIASCPPGKLGASLHASIGGTVRLLDGAIELTAQGGVA